MALILILNHCGIICIDDLIIHWHDKNTMLIAPERNVRKANFVENKYT
ncbi:hypothetical protein J733_1547 [Acinetobacter sp. 263903-2]|nr:hypothetical protein J733_1547 [Acinetobacter sp. 263903-2]